MCVFVLGPLVDKANVDICITSIICYNMTELWMYIKTPNNQGVAVSKFANITCGHNNYMGVKKKLFISSKLVTINCFVHFLQISK